MRVNTGVKPEKFFSEGEKFSKRISKYKFFKEGFKYKFLMNFNVDYWLKINDRLRPNEDK